MFGRLVSCALAFSVGLVGLAAAPAQAAGGELRLNPSSYRGTYPVSAQFSPTYRPDGGFPTSVPADITFAPAGGGASQPCPAQTCTPPKPGSYTVTATWDGVTTTGSLIVDKLPQDLRLTNTPARPQLGDSWRPEVTTPSSGTTVISAGGYACTYADGVITIIRATNCTVSVSNPGDDFYQNAAVSESFTVSQVGTTLALRVDPATGPKVGVPLTVEATVTPALDGQLMLTLGGATFGVARVVGGTATFSAAPTRAGGAVLHGDFRPSDPITYRGSTSDETVDVALGEKTLDFVSVAPTTAVVGDTYQPVARPSVRTGTIRYGVAAESADVCAWTGTEVRFDRVGECVVTADQDADPDHLPAPQVHQVVPVNAKPTVSAGPGDQSVLAGETATFSVATEGSPAPTVQWQRSTNGGDTFADLADGDAVAGATEPVLRVTAAQSDDQTRYRAVVTNAVGQVASPAGTLSVRTPATITSPAEATFETGLAGTHTVTTAGTPQAVVSVNGSALPTWLQLSDHGDGTATLAGTPPAGAGGVLDLALSATNGAGTPATQQLRLVINQPAAFTSPATAALVAGAPGVVTVTTRAGYPARTRITADDLPDGLRLTDHGDGTATIAGTPTAGGTGSVTLTASNGAAADATQNLDLLVYAAPLITSPADASFTILQTGSFGITAGAGYPASTRLALVGDLPDGLRFTDHGDGTATIGGSPAPGSAGPHEVTVTATPERADGAPASPPAAATVTQRLRITVARAAQLIALTPQDGPGSGSARVGETYTPAATTSSGLPVAFAVHPDTTGDACALVAGTVRFQHAGTCVVEATQSGDATYAPAPDVQQRIDVRAMTTDLQVRTAAAGTVYGQAFTATATVSAGVGGPPAGTVRFSVDGANVGGPVPLVGGVATSPELQRARGGSLDPDAYDVEASFTAADPTVHEPASGDTIHVVARAATTTRVQVGSGRLVSTTAPVAPGAGTPGGTAEFFVDGSSVGTRPLVDGVATLPHDLGPERGHAVSVDYSGDARFSASSASSSRRNPTITARLSSSQGPTRHGWYRTPVRVTFTCATDGAPLTTACPSPVVLDRSAPNQTVTRTIHATDGGTATVVTPAVAIDRAAPRVRVRGLRDVRRSFDADDLRCVGTDRLSGVARCDVVTRQRGATVRYRATSTDRAGNTTTRRGRLRLATLGLRNTPYDGHAYRVRAGRAYTLTVFSRTRPQYVAATPSPRRPYDPVGPLRRAGRNAWSITIHITPAMARTRHWRFGVVVDGRLRIGHLDVTR